VRKDRENYTEKENWSLSLPDSDA